MNLDHLLNCNVRAELARRNFIDFVLHTNPSYQANWHHIVLCEYLDRFIKGEIKRLMVFMPPQHGKSQLVSRNLPAYILGKEPLSKIVLASYSSDLACSFNRDCQRIIDSDPYHECFPKTILNKSNVVTVAKGQWLRNADIFETVGYGGFLKTVGVGGSLTGTPADFAIIDDPVKDSVEAMSATYQYRNWNWYNDVLYTRIHNNTGILITQTRWDTNDLSGKLVQEMEKGGEQWVVLTLPALKIGPPTLIDPRDHGEALWPDRHGLAKLETVRRQSLRTFEALYQQNPRPVQSGGEFWKQFAVDKHTGNITTTGSAIHVSVDNNVNPYVPISIWQIEGYNINQIHELACTDPDNNAPKAARKLSKWLHSIDNKDILFVYGDPSAQARSTIDEDNASFFDKFIAELRTEGFRVVNRVQRAAPQVAMSATFINDIYEANLFGYSITINNTCVYSIEDYYTVKEGKNGEMIKAKRKDPATGITYEPYGHFSDTKRYFITTLLSAEYNKYRSRSRRGGSIPGSRG